MAAMLELQATLGNASAACSFGSYDGTYIWFVTRNSAGNSQRLYRMRVSDNALIKSDGTVGDATNAYVALDFTNFYGCVVSDGTYVSVNEHNTANCIEIFNASNMARTGSVAISSSFVSQSESGFAYGGYHYFPGWDNGVGRACIYRINPSARTYTKVYTSASPAGSVGVYLSRQGGYAYITDTTSNGFGVDKVDMGTWTRVWLSASTGTARIGYGAYDSIRQEWWFSTNDAEFVKVRDSDGAYLTRASVADTYANAKVASATDGAIGTSGGTVVSGTEVYIGGASTSLFVNRRSTSPATNALTGFASAQLSRSALYSGFNLTPQFVIGNRIYMMMNCRGASGWGQTGVAWWDMAGATPALTAVTPGTGPATTLVFDAAVNVGTPTIGPASSGLGVTGVTQVSSTSVKIAQAARPDHPDGAADYNVPKPPVGGGAVIV